IKADALERTNLVDKPKFSSILKQLQQKLYKWQVETEDPWRCAPHAVLQAQGVFKKDPVCLTLGHEALQRPKRRVLTQYEEYVLV
ncbi:hypothetical protein ACLKA6_016085, partial [Drosophila palustris]